MFNAFLVYYVPLEVPSWHHRYIVMSENVNDHIDCNFRQRDELGLKNIQRDSLYSIIFEK